MTTLAPRATPAGLPALALTPARAQTVDLRAEFPNRPRRFIVGFPPGGTNDLLARLIAPGIGERLGRSVVADDFANGPASPRTRG